jgi:amidase
VSNAPFGSEVTGFGTNGPLARTVRDAAAMLDAMAGPVVGDPAWAPPLPPGETFLSYADRPPGRLRIGRTTESAIAEAELEPEVAAALDDAARLLEELGHEVEDVPPGLLGPEVLPNFERAMEALFALRLFSRSYVRAVDRFDVLLAPVCTMTPRPLGWFTEDGEGAPDFERQKRYAAFTALYNVTGQPAVSLPLGWSDDGLPIGSMLVGRPADEATLIALSAQLEEARPWAHRHPPGW